MHEPGSEAVGVAAIATQLKTRLETLARLQGELARRKAKKAMIGGGIAAVGVILLALSLFVGLAAIAAALATVVEPWLAVLILFGALAVLGLLLVMIGVALLKRKGQAEDDQTTAALTVAPAGSDENV